MAEEQTPAPEADAQEQGPPNPGMQIVSQFIRDLSFENPGAPETMNPALPQPTVALEVELNARARTDGAYEVDLKLMATATRDDKPVFHVEILYGGVFILSGLEPDRLEQVLLIECPRFLFPFARRIIADLTGEGGFAPLRIDPIDFASIYMRRRAEVERQQVAAVQNV